MALPDSDYAHIPVYELSRQLLMQQCAPQHWRKWSMDYMHDQCTNYSSVTNGLTESINMQPVTVIIIKCDHAV